MPRIFVDADACPVRQEVERVGTRHKIEMLYVSNGGLRPSSNPLVRDVIVASGSDEADKWIAQNAGPQDVVVTADIVLADRCLSAGAAVMRPDGEVFTAANIGNQLAMRDLMADLRAADPFRQGNGRGFTKADRSRFLDVLERLLRQSRKI